MKAFIIGLGLVSFSALAQIDTAKLGGEWTSGCIQSQSKNDQGYVVEVYSFERPAKFQLKRTWFKEQYCIGDSFKSDSENGTFKIGKENTNNGFNPAGTFEVEFKSETATDKGLLWVNDSYQKLRISRGLGTQQNTMLGLFLYQHAK
jgi:hypothetical protein